MKPTYWENDILGAARVEYHAGNGELIGEIRKVGGSWEVNRIKRSRTETVALRPDRETAMACLIKLIAQEDA